MDLKALNTDDKIEAWDLLQLGENLGIAEKDFKLLMEAYRRRNLLDRDKNIVGIGTPKEYKSRFFKAVNKDAVKAGQNGAYTLSPSGQELIKTIESLLPVPYKTENKDKLAKLITRF